MTATPSIKVWVIMMAIILFITIPATTIGKGCQLCTGICGRTGWSVSANFPLFCRQLQPQSEILLSLSDVCAHFRMRKGQRGSMLDSLWFGLEHQCNAMHCDGGVFMDYTCRFLPDPGVSGVRSMGLGLSISESFG